MPRDDDDETVLPLAEERLSVSKRRVVTGRVRLRLATVTEDVPVVAELEGATVEVTRVPMDREIAEVPEMRVEGDVTIVPVFEEVLVVERRLVLREEVHLRRVETRETVESMVPLRRQHVVIEREGEGPSRNPSDEEADDERL